MLTVNDAKSMARAVESALRARNVALSHGECLDIVARQFGLRDWNTLSARARSREAAALRRKTQPKAWAFLTEHPAAYDHGIEADDRAPGGRAVLVRFDPDAGPRRFPDPARAFGGYVQTVSAVPFHGRRLEIRAHLRCAGVTHGATIWARADGMPGHILAFDNLRDAADGWLFGDAPWTVRRIVLDVPPGAASLHFGFFLKGAGSLWAADVSVEAVDAAVPLTAPQVARAPSAPSWITPANLRFSDTIDPFALAP